MRIFKTKPFARFAGREGIADAELHEAVRRAERGLIAADLGGGVIKQRIARKGQGRFGGYRAVMLFRQGEKVFSPTASPSTTATTCAGTNWLRSGNSPKRCLCSTTLRSRQRRRTGRLRRSDAMAKQYRTDALAAVHETALGLRDAGVMDKRTMKVFDDMCLTPVETLSPDDIREIRLREAVSQAVFARYLNVTTGLVSQWERGEKRPRGASLKLLTLVARKGLNAVA